MIERKIGGHVAVLPSDSGAQAKLGGFGHGIGDVGHCRKIGLEGSAVGKKVIARESIRPASRPVAIHPVLTIQPNAAEGIGPKAGARGESEVTARQTKYRAAGEHVQIGNAVVRHVRLRRNIGTNAYALGFLEARYQYLVDMDDDILAVSKGWDRATIDAFDAFPRLGFLAMNVVQDQYTDGAKKSSAEYTEVVQDRTTLAIGPTGGWFSVTTRAIYNEVGGFVFKPHKPFPAEDGKYVRELSEHGYFAGILKNKYVYHASGPYWNCAYGYRDIWDEKYLRDHKQRLPWIRNVHVGAVPSFQYAENMVVESE